MINTKFISKIWALYALTCCCLLFCSIDGYSQIHPKERQWQEWIESEQHDLLRQDAQAILNNRRESEMMKQRVQLYVYLSYLIKEGRVVTFSYYNKLWDESYGSNDPMYAPIVALYKGLFYNENINPKDEDLLSDAQKMKDLRFMIGVKNAYARQEKYSKFSLYSEAIQENENAYKLLVAKPLTDVHKAIQLLVQQTEFAIYDQNEKVIKKNILRLDSLFALNSNLQGQEMREWEKIKYLIDQKYKSSEFGSNGDAAELFIKMHELSISKKSKQYQLIDQIYKQLAKSTHTVLEPEFLYAFSSHFEAPKEAALKQLHHLAMMRMANYIFLRGGTKTALLITQNVLDQLGEDRLKTDLIHYNLYLDRSQYLMALDKGELSIESVLLAIMIASNIEGEYGVMMENAYSMMIDHCNSLNIYENALPYYDKMMTIRKQVMANQFSLLTEEDRNRFWHGRAYDYGFLFNALRSDTPLSQKEIATRLADASIFSKQLLLSSTKLIEKVIEQSKDPKVIAANSRTQELQSIYYKNLYNSSTRDSVAHKLLYDELRGSEQNLLRMVAPNINFKEFWNRSWTDIQQKLSPNEVYVDYIRISIRENVNYLVALMIRPEWNAPVILDMNHEVTIMQHEEMMRKADSTALKTLSEAYFAKIEEYLKPQDRVYLSPGGFIHLVPFEVLPSSKEDKALADRYELRRISSFEDIIRAKSDFKIKHITLIGGLNYQVEDSLRLLSLEKYRSAEEFSYLRNASDEIKYIKNKAALKRITSTQLTDFKATESKFKKLEFAPNSVLHIATHAFSNKMVRRKNDRKGYGINFIKVSGLALSNADEAFIDCMDDNWLGEGFLSAEEIEHLNLQNVELVVLSACNTAGGMVNWEGVWGLHRAFKKAGAKSLLVTLWNVNDHVSAQFMKIFYDHLFETQDRHKAFRAAQNQIRTEHPNDPSWAAFILLD